MALTEEHVRDICKFGQGQQCCRYLILSSNGFECAKPGALKGVIDSKAQYMSAQADNCKGVKDL